MSEEKKPFEVPKIYTIYDSVADEFTPNMFVAKNNGVATRLFLQSIEKLPDNLKNDLHLYCLGKFYSNTGKIFSEISEVVLTSSGSSIDDVVDSIGLSEKDVKES